MTEYIREVQMANRLGYTEIEEFRRAISRGEVLAPAMYLGSNNKKPIWDAAAVDRWLGKAEQSKAKDDVIEMAKAVA